MYRFAGAIVIVLLAACGGGSSSPGDPFGKNSTATPTPSQQVAGARDTPTTAPTAQPTAPSEYTVVAGDTLSEIAARFNTDVATLVTLNSLSDPNAIAVGQVLRITGAAGTPPAGTPSAEASASPTASPAQ